MKKLVIVLALSLASSALPSSAEAQEAPSWPSVTDFAAPGPFAITH